MQSGFAAAVGMLGALAGCLRSTTRDCGDGGVCPAGLQCAITGPEICVVPSCGNDQIDPGETCDDGNNASGDACPADCGVHALRVDGGPFHRRYDPAPDRLFPDMDLPATVSSFRLDKYEVTVGRFRAFVEAGMGTRSSPPPSGAGTHPNVPGSGWDASWNASLATSTDELLTRLSQDLPQLPLHTWTDVPAANENRPINNLTWYEAMAFCIWDGGYLPTSTEWSYAAAGG